MVDKVSVDRIKLMHPKVKNEVEYIYKAQVVPALSGKCVCRFAYTLRTFAEQDALYAQGRTKLFDSQGTRLGKVTNAKGGQSIHNYGLAFDIVLLIDKDKNGTFESISYSLKDDLDKDKKVDFMEVVNIFKQSGWEWGGDWKSFKDAPHFQKDFGYSWQQLKQLHDKKSFIAGTNYVKI
jgi:peptidoglycan L-alanyl-D-glutamate endopeptidase CwlK